MNYNDYNAAVERLRRVEGGEGMLDVYGIDSVHDMIDYDKLTIYDAEHDARPPTVALVFEFLGKPNEEIECDDSDAIECFAWHMGGNRSRRLYWQDSYPCFLFDGIGGEIEIKTIGQVLMLLSVFGKKEGAA